MISFIIATVLIAYGVYIFYVLRHREYNTLGRPSSTHPSNQATLEIIPQASRINNNAFAEKDPTFGQRS